MNLKNLKDKLKNKAQESKTNQFVKEHKSNIYIIGTCVVGTLIGLKLTRGMYAKGYAEGVMHGIGMAGISFDSALQTNNIDKDIQQKLAKDSGIILRQLIETAKPSI